MCLALRALAQFQPGATAYGRAFSAKGAGSFKPGATLQGKIVSLKEALKARIKGVDS
jgi:hypothetical protein